MSRTLIETKCPICRSDTYAKTTESGKRCYLVPAQKARIEELETLLSDIYFNVAGEGVSEHIERITKAIFENFNVMKKETKNAI